MPGYIYANKVKETLTSFWKSKLLNLKLEFEFPWKTYFRKIWSLQRSSTQFAASVKVQCIEIQIQISGSFTSYSQNSLERYWKYACLLVINFVHIHFHAFTLIFFSYFQVFSEVTESWNVFVPFSASQKRICQFTRFTGSSRQTDLKDDVFACISLVCHHNL